MNSATLELHPPKTNKSPLKCGHFKRQPDRLPRIIFQGTLVSLQGDGIPIPRFCVKKNDKCLHDISSWERSHVSSRPLLSRWFSELPVNGGRWTNRFRWGTWSSSFIRFSLHNVHWCLWPTWCDRDRTCWWKVQPFNESKACVFVVYLTSILIHWVVERERAS